MCTSSAPCTTATAPTTVPTAARPNPRPPFHLLHPHPRHTDSNKSLRESSVASGKKERIVLCVDDDEINQMILQGMLRSQLYRWGGEGGELGVVVVVRAIGQQCRTWQRDAAVGGEGQGCAA